MEGGDGHVPGNALVEAVWGARFQSWGVVSGAAARLEWCASSMTDQLRSLNALGCETTGTWPSLARLALTDGDVAVLDSASTNRRGRGRPRPEPAMGALVMLIFSALALPTCAPTDWCYLSPSI